MNNQLPFDQTWQWVTTYWIGNEFNAKAPIMIATVFQNDKAFPLAEELADVAPELLHSWGKVVGRHYDGYSTSYVIQRPKVKTRSKGARRRARMAR